MSKRQIVYCGYEAYNLVTRLFDKLEPLLALFLPSCPASVASLVFQQVQTERDSAHGSLVYMCTHSNKIRERPGSPAISGSQRAFAHLPRFSRQHVEA